MDEVLCEVCGEETLGYITEVGSFCRGCMAEDMREMDHYDSGLPPAVYVPWGEEQFHNV